MAVSDFTDLDLKLASAEVTISTPKPSEIGGSLSSSLGDDSGNETNLSNLDTENGGGAYMENGVLGDLDIQTPVPISQKQPTESSSKRGRKRAGATMDAAVFMDPSQYPGWLPEGWKISTRIRPGGKTAGSKDTYYHEPITNKQFRSRIGVVDHVAKGCPPSRSNKKLKGTEDTSNILPLRSAQPLNFETATPPEKKAQPATATLPDKAQPATATLPDKITWVLGDSAGNLWTPFIGEKMVPEQTRLEWAAMFNPFAAQKIGAQRS